MSVHEKKGGIHKDIRDTIQTELQIEIASLVLLILIVLGIAALDYENNCEIIAVHEMKGKLQIVIGCLAETKHPIEGAAVHCCARIVFVLTRIPHSPQPPNITPFQERTVAESRYFTVGTHPKQITPYCKQFTP